MSENDIEINANDTDLENPAIDGQVEEIAVRKNNKIPFRISLTVVSQDHRFSWNA